MTLEITRDRYGVVTIFNPATGKLEVIATGTAGRAAQISLGEAQTLPAHSWSRLA